MPRPTAQALSRRSWMFRLPVMALLALALAAPALAQDIEVLADLPYKSGASLTSYEQERCKLDLYLPAEPKGCPTLVWFHGGGLTGGQKASAQTVAVARSLAQGGVAVASVNYRLSPKAKFPAYLEDAAAAFAWIKAHIAAHGGDSGKVFIGGHSAGAYVTLMVGLDDRFLAAHKLKLSDIAGLVPIAGQTLTHYTVRVERGLPKTAIIADEASPLHHARKDAPPMLILFADNDMAMRAEENQLLAAALKAAGHTGITATMIEDRTHGSISHGMANLDDPVRRLVLQFIKK